MAVEQHAKTLPCFITPLKKIHIAYITDSHPSVTLCTATQSVLNVVIKWQIESRDIINSTGKEDKGRWMNSMGQRGRHSDL